jgi:hypothetical protein
MSNFTNDLNVGDLTTGYHNGYHRVTKVERKYHDQFMLKNEHGNAKVGDEYYAQITYERVLNKFGEAASPVTNVCCASYCEKMDRAGIVDLCKREIDAASAKMSNVLNYI